MNADQLPPEALSDRWMNEHFARIAKMIPGFRAYAVNHAAKRAVCALLAVHQQSRNASLDDRESAKFLAEALRCFPGALQDWRPGDSPALPEVPRDPVTGQPMRNPYEKPVDLTSASQLAQDMPELAAHLKEIAKLGGSTYARIKRLREEKEKSKVLGDIEYTHEQHRKNPYLDGDLQARSEFRAKHGDAIADIYKREAETPIKVPWHRDEKTGRGNLTMMMQFTKRGLRDLVDKADALEKLWAERDIAHFRASDEQNRERRQSAETLLASTK